MIYWYDLPVQMKLPEIQKIMMEFEKQSEIMDMKEEMMNDAIDDAMGDEDDVDERWEAVYGQFQRYSRYIFYTFIRPQ